MEDGDKGKPVAAATAVAMDKPSADKTSGAAKGGDDVVNPLGDSRFSRLFSNPDFEIDMYSEEYRQHHPDVGQKRRQVSDLLQDKFRAVPDDEEESAGSASDSSDDEDLLATVTGRRTGPRKERTPKDSAKRSATAAAATASEGKGQGKDKGRAPQMYEVREGEEVKPLVPFEAQASQLRKRQGRNFGALVRESDSQGGKARVSRGAAGGKTIVFTVRKECTGGRGFGSLGGRERERPGQRRLEETRTETTSGERESKVDTSREISQGRDD